MKQRHQQGSAGESERAPVTLAVELPFEDGDVVAQGQDLYVLGSIAHRQ